MCQCYHNQRVLHSEPHQRGYLFPLPKWSHLQLLQQCLESSTRAYKLRKPAFVNHCDNFYNKLDGIDRTSGGKGTCMPTQLKEKFPTPLFNLSISPAHSRPTSCHVFSKSPHSQTLHLHVHQINESKPSTHTTLSPFTAVIRSPDISVPSERNTVALVPAFSDGDPGSAPPLQSLT